MRFRAEDDNAVSVSLVELGLYACVGSLLENPEISRAFVWRRLGTGVKRDNGEHNESPGAGAAVSC